MIARYDGIAEWYLDIVERDEAGLHALARDVFRRELAVPDGACLDVSCGSANDSAPLAGLGWTVVGLDLSAELLRRTAAGVQPVRSDAHRLPFRGQSFGAAVMSYMYTDVSDFPRVLAEVGRLLHPGGRLVAVELHPCFVGPFAAVADDGRRTLDLAAYHQPGWVDDSPTFGDGVRRRVGVSHLPVADFLNAFLAAGLVVTRLGEPPSAVPVLTVVAERPLDATAS